MLTRATPFALVAEDAQRLLSTQYDISVDRLPQLSHLTHELSSVMGASG